MTNRHDKYLRIAALIAEGIPKVANARLASLVVLGRDIISIGTSQRKTHPFQDKYKKHEAAKYWHSETNSIFNALKKMSPSDLSKSTLYVARVKEVNGKMVWGLAKPCSGCTHAITQFDIKQVIYTCEDQSYSKMF